MHICQYFPHSLEHRRKGKGYTEETMMVHYSYAVFIVRKSIIMCVITQEQAATLDFMLSKADPSLGIVWVNRGAILKRLRPPKKTEEDDYL